MWLMELHVCDESSIQVIEPQVHIYVNACTQSVYIDSSLFAKCRYSPYYFFLCARRDLLIGELRSNLMTYTICISKAHTRCCDLIAYIIV